MKSISIVLKIIGAICILVLIGIALGLFGGKEPPKVPEPISLPGSSAASLAPVVENAAPVSPARPQPSSNTRPAPRVSAPAAPANTNVFIGWEDKLDQILTSEAEEPAKAKQMLELFPRLPEDGQVEVAQHLSNLLVDADYAPLGNIMTNAVMSESVLDVLLADALNRPNAVKLPLLLEIARNEQHPKATEARDLLELFLEEDHGKDWNQWQARMDQWLKDNPD